MKKLIEKTWKVRGKLKAKSGKIKVEDVIKVLLKNRGITTKKQKEEFFKPTRPSKVTAESLGISKREINKTIKRLKKARDRKEKIVIYGDYDTDGICATAILWECLYNLGFDVTPHIPDRFEEGYGINSISVENLMSQFPNLKLIITVDNGIVAYEAVGVANKFGIDVIITDHHKKENKLPKAFSIVHTTEVGGAGISWFLSSEILKAINMRNTNYTIRELLELAAIGTIADQIPLLGVNRALVKYGLDELNKTKRAGLLELFRESRLEKGNLGTYEVGYMIAPRINAMGRLAQGIDSLRLLCVKSNKRAVELARVLGKTNRERQKIVEEVVLHADEKVAKRP